ncbi:EspF repeat-containing protein [Prosthecobacter sp.]
MAGPRGPPAQNDGDRRPAPDEGQRAAQHCAACHG